MNFGRIIEKPYIDSVEVLDKRNENSKTFQNLDGTYTWNGNIGPIHFKQTYNKNEQWEEIDDEHTVDIDDYILYDKMPIKVKIFKNNIGYEIESRKTGHKYKIELENKGLSKDDVEFEFDVQSDKVRLWKIIKTDKVKSIKWKITEENKSTGIGSLKFRKTPEAIDLIEKNIDGKHKQVSIVTKKTAINDKSFYWEEKGFKSNLKIDTDVNYQISVGANDGYWSSSSFQSGTSVSPVGTSYSFFGRVLGVLIPNGATINSAVIQVLSSSGNSLSVNTKVYLNDENSATAPTSVATADGKAVTSGIDWDISSWSSGSWKTSPSIITPVSEIINRIGWESGNDMMVLWKNDGGAAGKYIQFCNFETTGNVSGLKLVVTYTSAGSASASPSVSISTTPSSSASASVSPTPSVSISASPSISDSVSVSTTPSSSVSLSKSPSPSISPSVSVSATPSISASISLSLSPSVSESKSPSLSASISVSATPSSSASSSLSLSPSISSSVSESKSPSVSSSVSVSATPSSSVSLSISPSPSISASVSLSLSPSISESVSASSSLSPSPSVSASASSSPSPSISASVSVSLSLSPSPSVSASSSMSPSPSVSQSVSASSSLSPSPSVSASVSVSATPSISSSPSPSISESKSPSVSASSSLSPSPSVSQSVSVSLSLSPSPSASPSQSDYIYHRPITINAAMVAGVTNITDYVFKFESTIADLKTTANGGDVTDANGYDIIFTSDEFGNNILDFEVEKYDATTGQLIAWVRIPILDYDDDTVIYLQYSNESISTFQGDIDGTWQTNFKAVYHLNGNSTDSSDNNHDGSDTNITYSDANGKVAQGAGLNGSSSIITLSDHADFKPTGNFTLGTCIKIGPNDSDDSIFVSHNYFPGAPGTYYGFQFYISSGGALGMSVGDGLSDGDGYVTTEVVDDSEWHLVVITKESGTLKFYIDGQLVRTVTDVLTIAYYSTNYVRVGASTTSEGTYYGINGALDELFLLNGEVLTAGYIETKYNNLFDAANFYTVGDEGTSPSITPSVSLSLSPSVSISSSLSPSLSVSVSKSPSVSSSVSVSATPSSSASTSASPTPSISQSASPSASSSSSTSATPSISQSVSASISVSATPSVSASVSASTSSSISISLTPSSSTSTTPSSSPSVSSSLTPSSSESVSASVSASVSSSTSASQSASVSDSSSVSATPSVSASASESVSASLSESATPSVSDSISSSVSVSASPSVSSSISESVSSSISASVSASVSVSLSPSVSVSKSPSISPSVSVSVSVSSSFSPSPSPAQYTDKYEVKNTVYTDKYEGKNTAYTDKYEVKNTVYTNKYREF